MKLKEGNILDIDRGIIVHQVNAQGVMGAGLAKAIRNKYPKVYVEYKLLVERDFLQMGRAYLVDVKDDLYVCNLVAQEHYGRNRCFTKYDALTQGVQEVYAVSQEMNLPLYFPYGIGCGLAGGDWNIVYSILQEHAPFATLVQLIRRY